MPRGTRRRAALGFLLIVPVAMGSCAPRTLDTDQLERRLGRELSDQLGVPGIGIDCPDDLEARDGAAFRCTARAPNEQRSIEIEVTQVDDDGNVTWELSGAAE